MTAAERIAWALADRLGGLDAAAMARHRAFQNAVDAALAVIDEAVIVEAVVRQGGLAGAQNPHAVIVSRLRELPSLVADRRRLADEVAEAARWRQVARAARRGENLRTLVARGDLYLDEAAGQLAREFAADDDLRATAAAALTGGPS